jgi:hypothetical protein
MAIEKPRPIGRGFFFALMTSAAANPFSRAANGAIMRRLRRLRGDGFARKDLFDEVRCLWWGGADRGGFLPEVW